SSRRAGGERSRDARSRCANIWISCGAFGMGRMSEGDTTNKDDAGPGSRSGMAGERLWKSRSVETPKQGFHCAWKSRKGRGIHTFPQPRRRRSIDLEPDISCATKTGHFNLLTTGERTNLKFGLKFLINKTMPDLVSRPVSRTPQD